MTEVILIGDDKLINKFQKAELKNEPYVTYLNENYHKDKINAYKIKSEYGARLSPFAIILKDSKPVELFYSEVIKDNFIETLINKFNSL